MARNDDELHAGFTGTPLVSNDGLADKAKSAVALVRSEADAVAAVASDHPHTTTGLLVAISAIAFGCGYLMGHASGIAARPGGWRLARR